MELMRGLAFVVLLFAGSAVGAELRQAEVCGDGTTHQAGYCPAVLSSVSCSATGATTGICSATSDETDGTRYVCATSTNTALTGAQIETCSGGAAIAGSSAAETGSNSVSLSGLTTDAAHYGQIVNESPEGWYSNRLVSSSFTPNANGAVYDLYATDSEARGAIPFAVNWPTPPTITSEATVTNNSELQASLAVNGRRTIVAPGTYSSLGTISGTDKEIVFQSGASVSVGSGTFSGEITGRRIKISGGTFTAGFRPRGDFGASDVLFDGITVNQEDGWNGFDIWAPNKFAFVNGTYDMTGYSFLVITPGSDFIFANNDHVCKTTAQGGRAPIRIQAPTRYVFVDNRIVNEEGNTYHTLRTHGDNTDVWFRNNQFEGPSGGRGVELQNDILEGPASSTRLYFYDNNSYNANGQGYTLDTGDGPITNVYADGNTVYNTTGSGQAFGSGTGWVIGNNPVVPYQSPPAWTPN